MRQPTKWAEYRYRDALRRYGEPVSEHDKLSTVSVRYGAFTVALADHPVDQNWAMLTIRYLTNETEHTRIVRAGSCHLAVVHEMVQLWRAMFQVAREMEGAQ